MTTPPAHSSRPDTIQRYLDERYLDEVVFTRDEIESVWRKAQEAGTDAKLPGISCGGQIKMAFDAQMGMTRALLWARGLRTVQSDKSHHFRLIDAVRVFANAEGNTALQQAMETLDRLRRTRNQAAYENESSTPEEAESMMSNLAVMQPLAQQSLAALLEHVPRQAVLRAALPPTRPR